MNKNNLIIFLIVFLGAFLRLYQLGLLPSGFHSDEILNGYVGRFTLQNGTDLYGNRWPVLYFDNFGDYPNILPMYLSGVSTFLFGVNEFAVRLPIALAGAATVFLLYKITQLLTKDPLWPFLAAFILAISPWHIVLSRATAEGVTASLVFLYALCCMLKAIKTERYGLLLPGYFCLGLTYFLYPSFRVLVPLVLFPSFLLTTNRRLRGILAAASLVFLALTIFISQTVWGKGRFDQTSVFTFNNVLATRQVQFFYSDGGAAQPLVLTRVFHNKVWVAAREVIVQYMSYWGADYLFLRGGLPQRYQLAEQGLFPISLLIAVIGALILIFTIQHQELLPKDKQTRKFIFFLGYITLLSPLPAALTLEDVPNVHRSALMGVLLPLFFAWTVTSLVRSAYVAKRWILAGLTILFVFEFAFFWHQYAAHGTITQAMYRHNEMKTLSDYTIQNAASYDAVYAPTVAHFVIHYLFRAQLFDASLAGKFGKDSTLPQIQNIFFNTERCPSQSIDYSALPQKALFIDRIECGKNDALTVLRIMKQADGHDAFRISELKR